MINSENRSTFKGFLELVRRSCEKLYPGIGRYDRVVYARIKRVSKGVGRSTAASKLWSVDVEILLPDLTLDPVRGIIKDVPVDPVEISTDGRAMFPIFFTGLIVRLGWMYGRRDLPYIAGVTTEQQVLPYAKDGELTPLLAEALMILARLRTSAVGPVPMKPTDYLALQQLLLNLPGVSLEDLT